MSYKMHLFISEMYYTLLDGFLELLDSIWIPSSLNLDQADGELLLEQHLLFQRETINLSLQLIHNAVHISDIAGGAFSLNIGYMDLKLHTVVGCHVWSLIYHFTCSSHHWSK